jgi:hypothetical protein
MPVLPAVAVAGVMDVSTGGVPDGPVTEGLEPVPQPTVRPTRPDKKKRTYRRLKLFMGTFWNDAIFRD